MSLTHHTAKPFQNGAKSTFLRRLRRCPKWPLSPRLATAVRGAQKAPAPHLWPGIMKRDYRATMRWGR
eukprot:4259244-Prymnesium_polylepis.2